MLVGTLQRSIKKDPYLKGLHLLEHRVFQTIIFRSIIAQCSKIMPGFVKRLNSN